MFGIISAIRAPLPQPSTCKPSRECRRQRVELGKRDRLAHAGVRGPRRVFGDALVEHVAHRGVLGDVDVRGNALRILLEPDPIDHVFLPGGARRVSRPAVRADRRAVSTAHAIAYEIVHQATSPDPRPGVAGARLRGRPRPRAGRRGRRRHRFRRSGSARRGTARSRCRRSRRRRPDPRRRQCAPRAPLRLVDEGADEPLAETGGDGARGLLRGLAARPVVEAALGLLARCPASTSALSFAGSGASGLSILPTAMQMSRPTVSASSIGPIGIPNASAASSTVSGAMPSSTQRIASIRYGASTRLTRKPGALLTGSGSLSIWRTNAAAAGTMLRVCPGADDDLHQHHLRDRIEKVDPDEPGGIAHRGRDRSRAGSTTCWSRGSRRASPSPRAPRTGFAWRRGSRRSPRRSRPRARRHRRRRPESNGPTASRMRRGSLSRCAKSFAARPIAGARRSAFWSCSVTESPRSAHQAAMSPPIVPAPTTCTCAAWKSPSLPIDFNRSCSRNTRIRFAAVGVLSSDGTDSGSEGAAASALPSCLTQRSRIAYGAG